MTDENSESDSDTEEKLKGEKTSCRIGHRQGAGELPRWPFLLNVSDGTEHPCTRARRAHLRGRGARGACSVTEPVAAEMQGGYDYSGPVPVPFCYRCFLACKL